MLSELIEALQIFLKYGDPSCPTHCEHDIMIICGIDPKDVSVEDKVKLDKLGFNYGDQYGTECFYSYKFGSA